MPNSLRQPVSGILAPEINSVVPVAGRSSVGERHRTQNPVNDRFLPREL